MLQHSLKRWLYNFCRGVLVNDLATIVRNTCRRTNADPDEGTFEIDTTPNAQQRHALGLIDAIRL